MDEQKRQKVLIAVLAAFALGAGGYYFFVREPASNNAQAKQTGPVQRRERATTADSGPRQKRVTRKKRRDKGPMVNIIQKRDRKRDDTKRPERRTRRGGKKTKTKKKELEPFG